MPKFEKGHGKRGGRKKGTPNKVTKELREMAREALERAGDVKARRAARADPIKALKGGVAYLTSALLSDDTKVAVAAMRLVGQTMEKQVKLDVAMRERVIVRNFTGLRIDRLPKSVLSKLLPRGG